MHEFPDLHEDYDFLKKFATLNQDWHDFALNKQKPKRQRVKSRFSLHPKRLSSESECSSLVNSPRKFNNLEEVQMNPVIESHAIGDCAEVKTLSRSDSISEVSNAKTVTVKRKQKSVHSSADLNFDKKFRSFVERTLKVINNIRGFITKGVDPCDGEEDFARKLRRAHEFSSRFSRVYLYPLIRQVNEITGHEKSFAASVINQKIIQAHQYILQGVQAYYNYLPNAIGNCCFEKLKSLLEQTMCLCQHHGLLRKNEKTDIEEFVNALQTHTELLLETIESIDSKSVIKEETEKAVEVKPRQIKAPKNRLSMYAVTASFRKDLDWKRAVEALAKKRYNVKSRYKTASFKHRPPAEKPHIVSLPSKIRLFPRRSSGILKNTPIKSPINENDIETMVGIENSLQVPVNSTVVLNHENNGNAPVRDSAADRDGEKAADLEKAFEVLRRCLESSGRDAAAILEKIASEVEMKKTPTTPAETRKEYKQPIVTVTGEKNARLICIKDENSIVEVLDDDSEEQLKSAETLQERKKGMRSNKSTIKISRLSKSHRTLKLLPKEHAINVIQYKLMYHNFNKSNPMYRKSTTVQPWMLMGQISDQLLDYLLQDVSAELEVSEIIQNLYNTEFQY